jgi:uncharacterized membrane protein YfcA
LLMAGLLAPLGLSLLRNGGTALLTRPAGHPPTRLFREGMVRGLAFGAGLIGGLYGIGGGSLLAPVLVSSGYLVADVAPAALLSTFVTSCVGAATYALAALAGRQDAAPDWPIGLACGVGGLLGGYLGASAAPHLPHDALRRLLGCAALALSALYLTIALAELSAT